MTLSYDAGLNDVVEPAVRQFLRSDTSKRNLRISTLRGAILLGLATAFLFRHNLPVQMLLAGVCGAIAGGLLNYFAYKPTVIRRVRRHLEKETAGRLPAKTIFTISDGKIQCECLDVSVAFRATDLLAISEDDQRIELSFGNKGLCTIPLRVFPSLKKREEFIEAIKCEQTGAVNPHAFGTFVTDPADAGSAPKASGDT